LAGRLGHVTPIRNAVQILRHAGASAHECGFATDIIDRQLLQMVRMVDDLLSL